MVGLVIKISGKKFKIYDLSVELLESLLYIIKVITLIYLGL